MSKQPKLQPTPSKLFPGQSDHEEILIFVRRHWMPFALWLFLIGIMLFSLVGIVAVLRQVLIAFTQVPDGDRIIYIALIGGTYLLFVNAIFFTVWIEQYLDVSIITTDRLVHIRQIGLFNRRVSELSLARVQDVSAHMHGYMQSIFQFGTVVVETAGGSGTPDFVIRNVSKPHVVANTILMIHDRIRTASLAESVSPIVATEASTDAPSSTMQETIVQHTPSIAPPHDYHHEHFQEDLLSQALEAREERREQHTSPEPESPPKSVAPNRLPPPCTTIQTDGELIEGQDVSIDRLE